MPNLNGTIFRSWPCFCCLTLLCQHYFIRSSDSMQDSEKWMYYLVFHCCSVLQHPTAQFVFVRLIYAEYLISRFIYKWSVNFLFLNARFWNGFNIILLFVPALSMWFSIFLPSSIKYCYQPSVVNNYAN